MSSKKYILGGDGLPKWDNPISHAVVVNNMCFVSGQLSVNSLGDFVSGSIFDEAVRSFSNFFLAIKLAGFERNDVVFVDIAFENLDDLDVVNELFCSYFDEEKKPARTVYEVKALPFKGKIKVAGTAVKDL